MRRVTLALLLLVACGGDDGGPITTVTPPPSTLKPVDEDVVEIPDSLPTDPEDLGEAPDQMEPDDIDQPDSEEDVEEVEEDVGPEPEPEPTEVVCDAGDEAWVKRTMVALMGRRPTGIRETRVLVDMIGETDRATVVAGLMKTPEFEQRWLDFFMDELRINRVGDKAGRSCWEEPLQPGNTTGMAEFLRDHGPLDGNPGVGFNMADVALGSLRLDDLSPLYLGQLFAMMSQPITGANVGEVELDITRRQDFGEIFEATYLHRNVVCVGCHNSAFGVTDHPDPALDRHWALPGMFEAAIYGSSSGADEMTIYSAFRHLNVVRKGGGTRPWGWSGACGRFNKTTAIPSDPAGVEAFFIEPLGLTASIWDVEEKLRTGFDDLREDGLQVEGLGMTVSGPEAFAYMVSARIVNQVWAELIGEPLTLVHYFSRNEAQRDILMDLTTHFVTESFSLKTLLTDIVLHPLYNEPGPDSGCAGDSPYAYPQVFDPWVTAEPQEELQANSAADGLHKVNARVLTRMLNRAMVWRDDPVWLEDLGGFENFQKAQGVFVKDAEPGHNGVDFQGLLAWESRNARCSTRPVLASATNSCIGYCGEIAPSGCYCDDKCAESGDCCGDKGPVCDQGEVPEGSALPDFIDQLELTLMAGADVTLRDLVVALKDRLLTAPDLIATEEAVIASLLGVDSLDAAPDALESWPDRLRLLCGVLVQTPQFWLTGLPDDDQFMAPSLVVGSTSYLSQCEGWKAVIFPDPTLWKVTCNAADLEIKSNVP